MRRLTLAPGIVFAREFDAVGDRRMGVEPEGDEGGWIGIGEINFTEAQKRTGSDFLRMRKEAVGNLEGIDVSLVLDGAADGVIERFAEEVHSIEEKQQGGHGDPIVATADVPRRSPTAEDPSKQQLEQIAAEKEADDKEQQTFPDMPQNVVTKLMTGDEENLISGHFLDGGVPDDDALGGAEACDIGIHLVGFGAGLHQKHALGGDGNAGAVGERGDRSGELWLGFGERLKGIEDGIEQPRREEDQEYAEGSESGPEIEPPGTRLPAEDADEDDADDIGKGNE